MLEKLSDKAFPQRQNLDIFPLKSQEQLEQTECNIENQNIKEEELVKMVTYLNFKIFDFTFYREYILKKSLAQLTFRNVCDFFSKRTSF